MTIRHLRTFIAVAELKNMSAAAGKLFVSQPTVSQTILELEQYYRAKLFERYPKKLCLTPAGEQFLEYARRAVFAFDSLDDVMANSLENTFLRVGATVTIGSCMISGLVTRLKEKNSALDVFVCVENTQKIEKKLLHNELDVALVEGKIKSRELVAKPVIEDRLVLVCGCCHPFAQRESVAAEELKGEPFILREPGSGTRELFEQSMISRRIPVSIRWECSNPDSIKQAVVCGHGLSVMSERLIEKELSEGVLQAVPVEGCLWKRNFHLVYHKNKYFSVPIQEFLSCMEEYRQEKTKAGRKNDNI